MGDFTEVVPSGSSITPFDRQSLRSCHRGTYSTFKLISISRLSFLCYILKFPTLRIIGVHWCTFCVLCFGWFLLHGSVLSDVNTSSQSMYAE